MTHKTDKTKKEVQMNEKRQCGKEKKKRKRQTSSLSGKKKDKQVDSGKEKRKTKNKQGGKQTNKRERTVPPKFSALFPDTQSCRHSVSCFLQPFRTSSSGQRIGGMRDVTSGVIFALTRINFSLDDVTRGSCDDCPHGDVTLCDGWGDVGVIVETGVFPVCVLEGECSGQQMTQTVTHKENALCLQNHVSHNPFKFK